MSTDKSQFTANKNNNRTKGEEEPRIYYIDEYNSTPKKDRREFIRTTSLAFGSLIFGNLCKSCEKDSTQEEDLFDPDELRYCSFCEDEISSSRFGFSKLIFTPDSKYLFALNSREIKMWEVPSGRLANVLTTLNKGSIINLVVNQDCDLIAVETFDAITIFDMLTGKILQQFESRPVSYLNFMPHDRSIIVNQGNGKLFIYNIDNGNIIRELNINYSTFLWDNSLNPDGNLLASNDTETNIGNTHIKVWDTITGELINNYDFGVNTWVTRLRFEFWFSDENKISIVLGNELYEWDLIKNEIIDLRRINNIEGPISRNDPYKAIFLQNGTYIILKKGQIDFYEFSSGKLIDSVVHPYIKKSTIGLSYDDKLFAIRNYKTILLWNRDTLKWINCFFDKTATEKGIKVRYYSKLNKNGDEILYAFPPYDELPEGGKCVCDLVSGEYDPSGDGNWPCSPHVICSCVPVFY